MRFGGGRRGHGVVTVGRAVPAGGVEADPGSWLAERAAAAVLGIDPSVVRLGHSCPHCGGARGADHGTPVLVHPKNSGAFVSISRAPGLVVAAASCDGPIGIDVESLARMAVSDGHGEQVDAVALHPREIADLRRLPAADRPRARTVQWTRKEALLKATGHGLRVAPESIHLSGITGGAVRLRSASDELCTFLRKGVFTPRFSPLDQLLRDTGGVDGSPAATSGMPLPGDLVGTVCVLVTDRRRHTG